MRNPTIWLAWDRTKSYGKGFHTRNLEMWLCSIGKKIKNIRKNNNNNKHSYQLDG